MGQPSEVDVFRMRQLRSAGWSMEDIAGEYDLSVSSISRYISGKTKPSESQAVAAPKERPAQDARVRAAIKAITDFDRGHLCKQGCECMLPIFISIDAVHDPVPTPALKWASHAMAYVQRGAFDLALDCLYYILDPRHGEPAPPPIVVNKGNRIIGAAIEALRDKEYEACIEICETISFRPRARWVISDIREGKLEEAEEGLQKLYAYGNK